MPSPRPWPKVKLGKLLTQQRREVSVDPNQEYQLIGAHWYARGLYVKETKPGSQIRASKLYRVEEGDFVYNRLFAWKGSFAIASEEHVGCFVSNEFPCFCLDENALDPRFLWRYFSRESAWNEALDMSFGATPTSRNRLKESRLLAMEIPLPPLSEQRRIVEKVERLAAKIEEARHLRYQARREVDALCRAIITQGSTCETTPMRELVRLRVSDVTVQATERYQFAGVYSFGRGVFRSQEKTGMDFAYTRLTRLRAGDFVYPKLMAWEGALGVVPIECEGCVVSPEFPVFEVLEDKILPEVLDTYFRMPEVWPVISGVSTGTNVRRRRLNPQDFLSFRMPLPSRSSQEKLRKVRSGVDALKRLQAETPTKLESLLASILDNAFRGEL